MNQAPAGSALEVNPPSRELTKGEREYRAFLRLLPDLLKEYRGKYVAIHCEKVVDSDTDDNALVSRVHAQIGYVPIHVGLVEDPLPVGRIPHYRHPRRG